jgi:glycosyltransferase involved in cell wall biosynthesis
VRATNGAEPKGIVYISPSDPWSPYSLSGISREICFELRRRGLLAAAVSPHNWSFRHQHGPSVLYKLERRLLRRAAALGEMTTESGGRVSELLRTLPSGSPVIYQFLTPELDAQLPLRRFRFVDLSLEDAIRTGAYGHRGLSATEIAKKRAVQELAFRTCEGVITLSTYAAEAIARDFDYPRERIVAIGAGSTLPLADVSKAPPGRYTSRRILFVGRDWMRKGGPLLLAAFGLVRKQFADATLTIVGPPEQVRGDGVEYVPPLDKSKRSGRAALTRLFLSSSVFCMPSECETWGLVYVEAAQAGLPIAGFADWAMPDIVVDRVTGILSRTRSVEGLAAGLITILSSPERMREMGLAARERARTVLDWPRVVDRLLAAVSPQTLGGCPIVPLQTDGLAAPEDGPGCPYNERFARS